MGFGMENYQQGYQKLSGILANFEAELGIVKLYGTSRNYLIQKKLSFSFLSTFMPSFSEIGHFRQLIIGISWLNLNSLMQVYWFILIRHYLTVYLSVSLSAVFMKLCLTA